MTCPKQYLSNGTLLMVFGSSGCIQLFPERLSEKRVKVHATILKGSLGNNKYSFH